VSRRNSALQFCLLEVQFLRSQRHSQQIS